MKRRVDELRLSGKKMLKMGIEHLSFNIYNSTAIIPEDTVHVVLKPLPMHYRSEQFHPGGVGAGAQI